MKTFNNGQIVRVVIKNKARYTSDLFKSINNEKATIIRPYNNAYLVEFTREATKKYALTHGGQWGGLDANDPEITPMQWWIESIDLI